MTILQSVIWPVVQVLALGLVALVVTILLGAICHGILYTRGRLL